MGPVAFVVIFLGAYVLLGAVEFLNTPIVFVPIGLVLSLLAITPLLSGLGWMIAGHGYIGGLILLLRAVTILGMILVLVREDQPLAVGVGVAVFVAEPIASAAGLALTSRNR